MKTNIVGVIIALILAAICSLNVMAKSDDNVSEVRKVTAFSSIEVTSVATIHFTQNNTYSFKIEGKEKYVKSTTSTVKDGCLVIGFKDGEENRQRKNGVTIYISAPDLKNVEFTGVGSFNCDAPLKLEDVKFQVEGVGTVNVKELTCRSLKVNLEGVGKANIHVSCDNLSADLDGVGHVTLSGTAGKANITRDGVGGVNTRDLKVGR